MLGAECAGGEVVGEYLVAGTALFCHFVCAELAHSDHMPDAFAGEGEFIVFALKRKALRGQVEGGAEVGGGELFSADGDSFYEGEFACCGDFEPVLRLVGELYIGVLCAEFLPELFCGKLGF